MEASDLVNVRPNADGSDDATFSRKTMLPNGGWHITEARVTDDGKGNIDAKVAKGADQPAEVERRWMALTLCAQHFGPPS